ncbi:selenide, water dikinase SelD [Jannaschia sp. LMIT008]|uniref:selenide, water dikinase SelD n=1 Tax=Jannaschia maritima TaxID=3032585 RepID=UPI002811CE25|nr:selenide, water dikinase SelD [Jannaschia sp. LMIT008]
MQTTPMLTRDLLLIGGGHAHALVLRRWGMAPLPGVRLTVVNPGPVAPYTGMLPGYVAGHYRRDELEIDLHRLCRFAGATLIDGAVTGIDAETRCVTVPGRAPVAYDVASIDVGITSDMPDVPGFADHAIAAKPLGPFARRWRAFLDVSEGPGRVAVIGGGVAGAELAMAMAHALRAAGRSAVVTVLERGPGVSGMGRKAAAIVADRMEKLGIVVRGGIAVDRIEADAVVLADGDRVASDLTVGAAGARPHGWLAASGLPVTDGYVDVNGTLGVVGRDDLFAAGDCVNLTHAARPKAGVFAVRAAPILHANLCAALTSSPMRRFRPQRTYLKLVSLGGRDAVAEKGRVTLRGPWLWRVKDRIDRSFMDRLTDLPRMTPDTPRSVGVDAIEPLCGACGSKVASGVLARALARLPRPRRDDILSGPGDDAAILSVGGGVQVVTTDHLRAFADDPVVMVRIAFHHALGDVQAMGAEPQAVLASLTLPHMMEALQARWMDQVMAALAEEVAGTGAALVGGHSTMGAEATFGFTITGLCDRPPLGHHGARAGDAIVLTRPLGAGVILAGAMRGLASGRDLAALLDLLQRPQGDAASILMDAHALTDVTGFGLAGHLANLCQASGVGASMNPDALRFHDGAEGLAAQGLRSTIWTANRRAAPVAGAGDDPRSILLHDPQTAGGFLAAVEADSARDLVARLRAVGHPASVIGSFEEGAGLRLALRPGS